MERKNILVQEIRSLYRKADQNRSMHGTMRDKYVFISKSILLYVAVGSAISAMFIFASVSPSHEVLLGFFSASMFIVSIIPGTLNFDLKILEHSTAVNSWGRWLRENGQYCNEEAAQLELENLIKIHDKSLGDYKKVMEETPQIPDRFFNKYKQKHLQKVEISKALDKTPFKSLRKLKKELSEQ